MVLYSDGQIYVGEWKDGKPEGVGVKTWPDGRIYDGKWLAGRPCGEGIKTYKDGSQRRGKWEDGNFIVLGEVPEHERKDHTNASKPIDASKLGFQMPP